MNNTAWIAYLNTLPPEHQQLAQQLMVRIQTVINSDRQHAFDEIQRATRRSDKNAERIDDMTIRLDSYEAQRAADVEAELERFAREQLPVDERDKLIAILHDLVARVKRLEDNERQSGKP